MEPGSNGKSVACKVKKKDFADAADRKITWEIICKKRMTFDTTENYQAYLTQTTSLYV
jgi:hypothetical protein